MQLPLPILALTAWPSLMPSPSEASPALTASACTDDVLLGERLKIRQPARGYRLGLDALLLAAWASRNTPVHPQRLHVLDLCAGTGVVGLAFSVMREDVGALNAVEASPELSLILQHNLSQGHGRFRVRAELQDVRELSGLHADVILMNPPYFEPGSGRLSPNPYRAMARHQVLGNIDELLAAAVRCMHDNTLFFMAYPVDRMARVESALERLKVYAHHRLDIASHPERPPWIRLLAIGRRPTTCSVHSPLVIHGHGASVAALHVDGVVHGDPRVWAPQSALSVPLEA
jgi:tRNA1Val (adenine37-N6)-methyltransferase